MKKWTRPFVLIGRYVRITSHRRTPTLIKTTRRMATVVQRLPEQEDDPGVMDDLVRELGEFAPMRQRANAVLLGDD